MDLELHSLKKFLAVAEELNFHRAAERLHVSQPALSQAIRRLEAHLGKDLFERQSHGVLLTDFGRTFYVIAHALVTQHDKAVAAALEAAHGRARLFRVGYSPFIDLTVVSAARFDFAAKSPDAQIEFRSSPSADQVALLVAGRLDVGLLASPFGAPTLKAEVLRREPFVVGLKRSHSLARRKSVSLDDLRDIPLIWFPRNFNPPLVDWFLTTCADRGYAPKIAQEATTLQEFLEFVARGLGIALLPRSAALLRRDGVVFRELAGETLSVEIVAAYRQDDESEILRRFVSYAKERFRQGA